LFLYHYLPTSSNSRASVFTVEKGNGIHITKSHFATNAINGSPTRRVIVENVKSPYTNRRPIDRLSSTSSSEEEAIDDTIYIDNDSYGDENYDINSNKNLVGSITTSKRDGGNDDDSESDEGSNEQQKQKKTIVTIIERPVERSPASDDDLYYENYEDETDDEDIVSSGDGKIIVNVKKTSKSPKQLRAKQPPIKPEPANYIENVYSVSSEIVSNLKNSQYNVDDNGKQQINQQPEDNSSSSSSSTASDDEDIDDDPPPPSEVGMKNGKRLTGNNKKLAERSRQLILCRSANMGELCRMLN
jgi:hypothetical protein